MTNSRSKVRVSQGKGWIRLRCPGMFQSTSDELCRRFAEAVLTVAEVDCVEIDPQRSVVAIGYLEDRCTPRELLVRLAGALRGEPAPQWQHRLELRPTNGRPIRVRSDGKASVLRGVWGYTGLLTGGLRRIVYLILGGAAFSMSLVGLVVPGIPTVPFLLLTSYCLIRAWPPLNDRLLRSRLFGSLIRNWQQHRAIAIRDKTKLLLFSAVIILATIVFAPPTLPTLVSVAVIGSITIYIVLRTPTLPSEGETQPQDVGLLQSLPAGLPA